MRAPPSAQEKLAIKEARMAAEAKYTVAQVDDRLEQARPKPSRPAPRTSDPGSLQAPEISLWRTAACRPLVLPRPAAPELWPLRALNPAAVIHLTPARGDPYTLAAAAAANHPTDGLSHCWRLRRWGRQGVGYRVYLYPVPVSLQPRELPTLTGGAGGNFRAEPLGLSPKP